MNNKKDDTNFVEGKIPRRGFIKAAGTITAGVIAAPFFLKASRTDDLNVALIGAGTQGRILLNDSLKIPKIRFKAVCDIWSYSQKYAKGTCKKYGHIVNVYEDYRELLEKEKDLDVVIVATPDWMHAEHAVACLKSGKNVYCEKEMSNSLVKASEMVKASNDTGKLLQIGHQRRSNPVYKYTLEMLDKDKICGKLTNCFGQWNRPASDMLPWPKRYPISKKVLSKFGYGNMDRFRNWRWYKKFSAGPIADLGSHQIDIFSWFLHSDPVSVIAVGGKDYYKDREWYEDVMAIYEYERKEGSARAFYQVLNTTGYGHYYERFHGDKGTVTISENPKMCYYVPEVGTEVPGFMSSVKTVERDNKEAYPLLDAISRKSSAAAKELALLKERNVHQFHLENFYDAVRANDKHKLTCSGEEAYPTAVAVLNVIPAVEAGKKIELTGKAYKGATKGKFFDKIKKLFKRK